MSRLILFIDPIWDCPLLCEEDHWSCTASDHLYSCAQTRHCGDCPVCFGPWGAWRAVLDQLVPLLAKMDRPFVIDETTTDEQMEAWWDTRLMWSERLLALGRLGWSP